MVDHSQIALVLEDVQAELQFALAKHGPQASLHESLAVIWEELDEFKKEVFAKESDRDLFNARKELIQTAAMAIRAILDVVDPLIDERAAVDFLGVPSTQGETYDDLQAGKEN